MKAHYAAHGKKKHGHTQPVGGNALKPTPRVVIAAVPERSFGEQLAARLALFFWAHEGVSDQHWLEEDL